jgi:hypothetical protein
MRPEGDDRLKTSPNENTSRHGQSSAHDSFTRYGRVAAVIPAAVVAAALTSPFVTPEARVLIFSGIAISLWSPVNALLIVASVAPMGRPIASRFAPALQVTDTLALAFLVGYLLHPPDRRRGPAIPMAAALAAGMLALVVIVQVAPGGGLEVVRLARAYLLTQDRTGMKAPALLEGIAVAFAATGLLRGRPALATRLPVALCGSFGVAGILARMEGSQVSVAVYFAFAMMACVAAGLAVRAFGLGSGAAWRRQFWWTFTSCAMLAALIVLAPTPAIEGRSAFTHVLQEAGAIGATLFVAVLATLLWRVCRGIAARPRDARLIGCALGALAFIAGGLARDMFSDPDGALPFWLLLGLTVGLAGSNLQPADSPREIVAPDNVQCS